MQQAQQKYSYIILILLSEGLITVNFIFNKSAFKTDVLLKATDDVMTLSTCYKFNHINGRLVVNAVRVGTSILN